MSNCNYTPLLDKMKARVYSLPTNYTKDVPGIKFKFKKNTCFNNLKEDDLITAKNLLDGFSKNKWNFFRDLVNPYEFGNIDKTKYINRAYFKLHEIIKVFDLEKIANKNIDFSGVCEFPCGFTKCILDNDVFSKSVINVNIMSNDDNKPKLNNYYKQNINIDIVDITDKEQLKEVLKGKSHKSMLVTSDGGINENKEYSKKEVMHYRLKLCEIGTSLRLLDEGGVLVIKFFDFFTKPSIEMAYYLSFFFKEMYMYKPLTSRPTNSERYMICKYMVKRESNLVLNIPGNLENLSSFLSDNVPIEFSKKMKKASEHIINTQINNIKFVVGKMTSDIDDREKKYFNSNKKSEQQKFFRELGVKLF